MIETSQTMFTNFLLKKIPTIQHSALGEPSLY